MQTASAKEYILVVLDTTGSMGTLSLGGATRLQVAKDLIASRLAGFTDATNEYALWYFEGATSTEILPFAIGNAAKANVITTSATAVLGGSTPLAHTICSAVDALVARGIPSDVRRIMLATDGEENNTNPLDQCGGVGSTVLTDIPFDDPSWQNKVLRKLCTGDASDPDLGFCGFSTDLALVIDVAQIFDFTPVTGFAASRPRATPVLEPASRLRSVSAVAPPVNIDQEFFTAITQITNGTYTGVTPQTPPDQVFLAPGDANHDGCVTLLDRTQVLRDSGTPGNGFDDFNHNGIVDNSDLQVVLQHVGECVPYISTAVPLSIPDNNATGATASVNVSSPALRLKTVKADVSITHTWRGDLVIQVIAPNGQIATLSNREGGSADNFVATGLDITSSFTAGLAAQGIWRLVVRDLAGGDVGTIDRFRLTFTTTP
jgi:hypothetical protein